MREFVAPAVAAACAVTDSAAAASAATAPSDYNAAAVLLLVWTLVSLLDQLTQSCLSAVIQLSKKKEKKTRLHTASAQGCSILRWTKIRTGH